MILIPLCAGCAIHRPAATPQASPAPTLTAALEPSPPGETPDAPVISTPAEPLAPGLHDTPELGEFFDGLNGCAVFLRGEEAYVYNPGLSQTRASPCSTFKIVSAAMGLEQGVIDPANSLRAWSGERFWNDDWNRDITFEEAFKTSCIWYFRGVIDDLGEARVQAALDALAYGNCDISDWQGTQNTANSTTELRGFWVESSLLISPLEQTLALKTLFEGGGYSDDTLHALEGVMAVQSERETAIFGKTGMGVREGKTVDAWFVGFFEAGEETIYFALRLDDPDNPATTSAKAREIAIDIIENHFVLGS